MAPKPKSNQKRAPNRTTALPAALRQELQDLGHIPAPGKGKLGRKERRKAARTDGSAARAEHFAKKKRKAEQGDDEEEEVQPEASGSGSRPEKKRKKGDVEKPVAVPKAKQTPLERLLAKQEGKEVVDPARKRNKVESTEDKEIAWLEAKLGVRGGPPTEEKGKWKDEFADDGLDDLFAGIDDLESAAFGNSTKDYSRMVGSDDDDEELDSEDGGDDDDEDSTEPEEFGIDEDELMDPSDDDDHSEMGELGSEHEDAEEDMLDDSDFDSEEEESEEGEEGSDEGSDEGNSGNMTATFDMPAPPPPPSTAAAVAAPTRYVPPHLRQAGATAAPTPSPFPAEVTPAAPSLDSPPEDPRLRRQILGLLNKLSSSNMPSIIAALEAFYTSHPRALVSTTLTSLLLEIVSGRDNLGEAFIITYAALVAALSKSVGIEFPAGVVARCVGLFDEAREKSHLAAGGEGDGGFEGRPGSKECENLVAFLAELYNFQVIACVLIYDLVKLFIDSGLEELEVELLVKVVKRSGQQLRQDDPSSLKDIIGLVKQKMASKDAASMNSRTRFMIDALTNLKNNKIKQDANGAVDNYSSLKKFISGLKKRSGSSPEALRLSLSDIRSSSSKGKWWIVGAAWGGDPLVEAQQHGSLNVEVASDATLTKLARAQGMNTDIRKGVFIVLMSSEDYVDACERLLQLGLTDIQQREIARVLLQCSGNEKTYNPYYTLVAHRMGTKSHSFQITLQYCLWDFLRELGEKTVGGEELVKTITDDGTLAKVSARRVSNLAKLYAWCVAKDVLSISIFKPVPFARPRPQTVIFLRQFFTALILSSQSASPALIQTTTGTRRDREALERVFVKAAPFPSLVKGMLYFLEAGMEDENEGKGKEQSLVKWGKKVAKETLSVGGGIMDVR